MSRLNKFKDSYQVLEKNPWFCPMRKKKFKDSQGMSKQFFWPNIFTTNTLCVIVYKMHECDKNQMPYYNVKGFKMSNFKEF